MSSKVNQQALAAYYQDLFNHPVPLVPYNPQALNVLSQTLASGNLTPEGLYAALGLGGPQSSKGWATVSSGDFNFPAEHGPHWAFRNEWYYAAFNLTYVDSTKTTQPLSILLAIIRRGTVPNYDSTVGGPQQFQVVGCEATIELPGTATPYITSSAAFDGFDNPASMQAPSASQAFQWSVNDSAHLFGLAGTTNGSMFPMNCGISFMTTGNTQVNVQLSLTAPSNPQYFNQGQNGCAPCLDGIGYRYYSWPALAVSGTVAVGTTTYTCSGLGWLDHQWGSRMQPLGYVDNLYLRALGILGGTYPQTIVPQWDWFFMHLNNGMHITTSVLPSKGYATTNGVTGLTNTSIVSVDAAKNNVLTYTTFQGNGSLYYSNWVEVNCSKYATSWKIQIGKDISLVITPVQSPPAGFSTGVDGQTFMEKAVNITGTVSGTAVTGVGFAEAIGYDSMDRALFNMLSQIFPPDQVQQYLPYFFPAKASVGDIALATLIVIVPPVLLLIIIITVVAVVLRKKAKKRRAAKGL